MDNSEESGSTFFVEDAIKAFHLLIDKKQTFIDRGALRVNT